MLNFVICDDNRNFSKMMKTEIENFMMNYDQKYKIFHFEGYDDSFEEFVKKEMEFKIYFLDIKTKCKSGLDAARIIREKYDDWVSIIVVVTSHEEYRYEALGNRLYLMDFINKLNGCQKTLKEDLDNVISYSITLKQVIERLKKLDYQVYSRNGIITIYRNGKDKVRIEKAFGDDYSIDNINKRLYLSRQIIFKPLPQRTIFEEYSKTNKTHKGIYGLFLYYCYLLSVFPKNHPKQYLPYSIRKEIAKLDEYSNQVRFMTSKKIETKEDLDYFSKTNYEEYKNLMGKRENLWKRYHRAKSEEVKSEILTEINDIQPRIKELRKYDKYCKDIFERSESIQNNLNNFDKNMQKEKDNIRAL